MNTAKCSRICDNKTELGYCKTTVCINPMYSNIGTYQCGQGVQRNIVTNADRIRAMTDDKLVDEILYILNHVLWMYNDSRLGLLDWLKQEVTE